MVELRIPGSPCYFESSENDPRVQLCTQQNTLIVRHSEADLNHTQDEFVVDGRSYPLGSRSPRVRALLSGAGLSPQLFDQNRNFLWRLQAYASEFQSARRIALSLTGPRARGEGMAQFFDEAVRQLRTALGNIQNLAELMGNPNSLSTALIQSDIRRAYDFQWRELERLALENRGESVRELIYLLRTLARFGQFSFDENRLRTPSIRQALTFTLDQQMTRIFEVIHRTKGSSDISPCREALESFENSRQFFIREHLGSASDFETRYDHKVVAMRIELLDLYHRVLGESLASADEGDDLLFIHQIRQARGLITFLGENFLYEPKERQVVVYQYSRLSRRALTRFEEASHDLTRRIQVGEFFDPEAEFQQMLRVGDLLLALNSEEYLRDDIAPDDRLPPTTEIYNRIYGEMIDACLQRSQDETLDHDERTRCLNLANRLRIFTTIYSTEFHLPSF